MTKLDDFANACWDFMATIGYAVEAAFDTVTHWISLPLRRLGLIQLPRSLLRRRWAQTCPACLHRMDRGVTTCPHCQFQPPQEEV